MTDLMSASEGLRLPSALADQASYGTSNAGSANRHTGRHRAAEEPEPEGVDDQAATDEPFGAKNLTTPAALAALFRGGVGAAAFDAAIDAARTSVSRRPVERRADDRIA